MDPTNAGEKTTNCSDKFTKRTLDKKCSLDGTHHFQRINELQQPWRASCQNSRMSSNIQHKHGEDALIAEVWKWKLKGCVNDDMVPNRESLWEKRGIYILKYFGTWNNVRPDHQQAPPVLARLKMKLAPGAIGGEAGLRQGRAQCPRPDGYQRRHQHHRVARVHGQGIAHRGKGGSMPQFYIDAIVLSIQF